VSELFDLTAEVPLEDRSRLDPVEVMVDFERDQAVERTPPSEEVVQDVSGFGEVFDEVARLSKLGAVVVAEHDEGDDGYTTVVMVDPDNNEFCVVHRR
jgi:hypothetical protein